MAFDKYSELDPAKMQRDIEEMHGTAFFDKYSILDDTYRIHQIENAFGVEISNDALLDPVRLMQEVVIADEGGGGSAPDWVPNNAKIHIDLIAPGRAWTEADGEVAIDTLLGSDPNTEAGWYPTEYNPTNLTGDGYGNAAGINPALIGALLSK